MPCNSKLTIRPSFFLHLKKSKKQNKCHKQILYLNTAWVQHAYTSLAPSSCKRAAPFVIVPTTKMKKYIYNIEKLKSTTNVRLSIKSQFFFPFSHTLKEGNEIYQNNWYCFGLPAVSIISSTITATFPFTSPIRFITCQLYLRAILKS